MQAIAGAAAAGCFALASYATPKALLIASAAGGLGAAGYGALQLGGAGLITASGGAAIAVGFAGGLIARRLKMPPLIVAVSGMVPSSPVSPPTAPSTNSPSPSPPRGSRPS
ncbi:threonine/serine exporter family protein [Actinokineospora soli]|uniref:Threonine/serine exporter family protein n=1 Tax=Actinokineospora soli TaxID=1048753 RepID=A0ABW2TGU5_9PSEU